MGFRVGWVSFGWVLIGCVSTGCVDSGYKDSVYRKNTPTNGLRKKEVDGKSDLSSTTPLRAKTFYKKAGNITKLEVFLHHDTKKKKKKLDSDVRKGSAMKESGSGLS